MIKTQRMLSLFLLGLILILGTTYLFLLNQVSMNGYVLSQITDDRTELAQALDKIDTQIQFRQTADYIADAHQVQIMEVHTQPTYAVIKRTYTAQKASPRRF